MTSVDCKLLQNVKLTVCSNFGVKTSYGCLHTHENNRYHCQVLLLPSHDKRQAPTLPGRDRICCAACLPRR